MNEIHRAILTCDLKKLKIAIRNGGDVNKGSLSAKPLHVALYKSHNQIEILKELLDNGAKINDPGIEKRTALHIAVSLGNVKLVKFLIENGADVNAVDRNKKTPLHFIGTKIKDSAINSYIALTLIINGADVYAYDNTKQKPVDSQVIKDAQKIYTDNETARKNLQELIATNGSELEETTINIMSRVLENHYGIKITESDTEENQKDINSEDDKKPAAKKNNSIIDNADIDAFSQTRNQRNSMPNQKSRRTIGRNLSNQKNKSPKK